MKVDKSSYYPKSPLGDDEEPTPRGENPEDYMPGNDRPARAAAEVGEEIAVTEDAGPAGVKSPEVERVELTIVPETADHNPQETYFADANLREPNSDASRFMTGLSHLLSWVLVPLMMPVYGVMLAFGLSILAFTPIESRIVFTLIVAAINVAVPAVLVLLLKRLGLVDDIGLNGRKERLIPYIITILCLSATGWFLYSKGAPFWLFMFFVGGAAAGVVELIVNFWWKISAHCAAIAGIVAMLIHLLGDEYCSPHTLAWLVAFILLSGLLGTARVWLNRHTVWQVLAGYAVGFTAVYLCMMIAP